MNDLKVSKMYNLYEILNDFSRMNILICLSNESKSKEEIVNDTKLNNTLVTHQLRYLLDKDVLIKSDLKYEIRDNSLKNLIIKMKKYIEK